MTVWLWHDETGWYWTYSEAIARARTRSKARGPYRREGDAKGAAKRHWATEPDGVEFVELAAAQ